VTQQHCHWQGLRHSVPSSTYKVVAGEVFVGDMDVQRPLLLLLQALV
jgi:hypothetical protein